MAHVLFVSYSSKDAAAAAAAVERFEAAGFACWYAPRDPVPGIAYARQIVDAIDGARAVVLLLSAASNASNAVLGEIEIAANRGCAIVPVRIEDVQPSAALEYYVRSSHWFDAFGESFVARLPELVAALPAILRHDASEPATPPERRARWRPHGRGPFAFLFTDIEGSTKLWERDPAAMSHALACHDAILRDAVESEGGTVFKTVGDAFCAVFPSATSAANAALRAQRGLRDATWSESTGRLNVRMGIHSGEAEQRDDDFFGPTLNRVARLQGVAHPGQILATAAVASALATLPVHLLDLGEHRLKDLAEPVRVYQIGASDLPSEFPPLATIGLRKTNLPVQPNELLGRESELARAAELLRDAPLLTVVATGGIGKTRFALQLAADASDGFIDGVWFVDLSALERSDLVASSIARVLGIAERADVPLLETIAAALERQKTLLVLDNCEQVIEGVAGAVAHIAARAKGVRFIATSREPVAIASERRLRLGPLGVPDPHAPPAELLAAPSVRLFIERARALDSGFAGDDDDALRTIAEICTRLDGIPLAIELAAARTGLFSVRDLAKKMDDLLRLLAQKRRDLSPRQQTLEGLVDWSYRLLDDGERDAFERLGTFAGRFDVEAAFGVAAFGELDELDLEAHLESLVDKSFLVVEGEGDARRLRMFETIRQFAERRLRKRPEIAAECAARHVAYYTAFADGAMRAGAEDYVAFEASLADVRAAFREALASPAAAPREGAALAFAIACYALQVAALAEGTSALERGGEIEGLGDAERAKLEQMRGEFALIAGRIDEARERFARVAERGDPRQSALACVGLAQIALAENDPPAALALIERALESARGDAYAAFTARTVAVNVELALGRRAEARREAERAYELSTKLGDRAVLFAAGNLGTLSFLEGDLESAARQIDPAIATAERLHSLLPLAYFTCVRAEIALFRGSGDPAGDARRALAIAFDAEAAAVVRRCVETLAAVAGRDGDRETAARLLAWIDAERANGKLGEDDDDRAISARKRVIAGASSDAGEGLVSERRMDSLELLTFVKEHAR